MNETRILFGGLGAFFFVIELVFFMRAAVVSDLGCDGRLNLYHLIVLITSGWALLSCLVAKIIDLRYRIPLPPPELAAEQREQNGRNAARDEQQRPAAVPAAAAVVNPQPVQSAVELENVSVTAVRGSLDTARASGSRQSLLDDGSGVGLTPSRAGSSSNPDGGASGMRHSASDESMAEGSNQAADPGVAEVDRRRRRRRERSEAALMNGDYAMVALLYSRMRRQAQARRKRAFRILHLIDAVMIVTYLIFLVLGTYWLSVTPKCDDMMSSAAVLFAQALTTLTYTLLIITMLALIPLSLPIIMRWFRRVRQRFRNQHIAISNASVIVLGLSQSKKLFVRQFLGMPLVLNYHEYPKAVTDSRGETTTFTIRECTENTRHQWQRAECIRRAESCMVVFSREDRTSFIGTRAILESVAKIKKTKTTYFPTILVGTVSNPRLEKGLPVSSRDGVSLAQEFSCPYIEVSPERKMNINEAFLELRDEMIRFQRNHTALLDDSSRFKRPLKSYDAPPDLSWTKSTLDDDLLQLYTAANRPRFSSKAANEFLAHTTDAIIITRKSMESTNVSEPEDSEHIGEHHAVDDNEAVIHAHTFVLFSRLPALAAFVTYRGQVVKEEPETRCPTPFDSTASSIVASTVKTKKVLDMSDHTYLTTSIIVQYVYGGTLDYTAASHLSYDEWAELVEMVIEFKLTELAKLLADALARHFVKRGRHDVTHDSDGDFSNISLPAETTDSECTAPSIGPSLAINETGLVLLFNKLSKFCERHVASGDTRRQRSNSDDLMADLGPADLKPLLSALESANKTLLGRDAKAAQLDVTKDGSGTNPDAPQAATAANTSEPPQPSTAASYSPLLAQSTDIMLTLDGGYHLQVHEALLAQRSTYFSLMLSLPRRQQVYGYLEDRTASPSRDHDDGAPGSSGLTRTDDDGTRTLFPVLHLDDVTTETAIAMIRWMYGDRSTVTDSTASDMLVAADRYDIAALRTDCEKYIGRRLRSCPAYALPFLQGAELHNAPLLKEACLYSMALHASTWCKLLPAEQQTKPWPITVVAGAAVQPLTTADAKAAAAFDGSIRNGKQQQQSQHQQQRFKRRQSTSLHIVKSRRKSLFASDSGPNTGNTSSATLGVEPTASIMRPCTPTTPTALTFRNEFTFERWEEIVDRGVKWGVVQRVTTVLAPPPDHAVV